MYSPDELKKLIESADFSMALSSIYYSDYPMLSYQKRRYARVIDKYVKHFDENIFGIFSAPGRTEIGGNHTDHQHGQVLAASVNLDAIAIVGPAEDNRITIASSGYGEIIVDLDDISPKEEEFGTSVALVKGIVRGFVKKQLNVGPFRAYITSDVISGSGLSSSAAFEVLIGSILSGMYNNMRITPKGIAVIGQYAENRYFGKPCGLMDQMACSLGGFSHINFSDPTRPVVETISFNLSAHGYSLCIIDTKASHADLTDDYSRIPSEMKLIANHFEKNFLGDVSPDDFYNHLPELKGTVSHRAILRALHFFDENIRVAEEVSALKENNIHGFLNAVQKSGDSSFKYLQNVYSSKNIDFQPLSLALAYSEHLLKDRGVCRIHGGGFAGTIQAFIKSSYVNTYKTEIEKVFGKNTCHILHIRERGITKML
ncbi:MAG: galactokinase [Lachnospiraceae bacterium]|nr:galactokinase [Lachnospiraceae bacterium]